MLRVDLEERAGETARGAAAVFVGAILEVADQVLHLGAVDDVATGVVAAGDVIHKSQVQSNEAAAYDQGDVRRMVPEGLDEMPDVEAGLALAAVEADGAFREMAEEALNRGALEEDAVDIGAVGGMRQGVCSELAGGRELGHAAMEDDETR